MERGVTWIFRGLGKKLFGGGASDAVDIERLSVEELAEERTNVRADVKLKRDRYDDLDRKRRELFEWIMEAADPLLKKELAEEISSVEDEMAMIQDEHTQLVESLRVIDGLIAIKRREEVAEQDGLINRIREMNRKSIVETLRRNDVRELIREEKWDRLNILLGDQFSTQETGNERVDEILRDAEDIRKLEGSVMADDETSEGRGTRLRGR